MKLMSWAKSSSRWTNLSNIPYINQESLSDAKVSARVWRPRCGEEIYSKSTICDFLYWWLIMLIVTLAVLLNVCESPIKNPNFRLLYSSPLAEENSAIYQRNLHSVQKKHPLTFSLISPWVMCRFKQKLQWIYQGNCRFWAFCDVRLWAWMNNVDESPTRQHNKSTYDKSCYRTDR